MEIEHISVFFVFLEGVASFFSPCIVPLLPVYFSYLAGSTIDEIEYNMGLKKTLWINTLGFVLGISTVYIMMGAGANLLGSGLYQYNGIIRKVTSIFVILFGIIQVGIFNIPILQKEKKFQYKISANPKFIQALLLGVAFSFGWTPCIGPLLGSVLFMASSRQNVGEAAVLLGIYALGLAIPFLTATAMIGTFLRRIKGIYPYFKIIKIVSGVLLITLGVLNFFDLLNYFIL